MSIFIRIKQYDDRTFLLACFCAILNFHYGNMYDIFRALTPIYMED